MNLVALSMLLLAQSYILSDNTVSFVPKTIRSYGGLFVGEKYDIGNTPFISAIFPSSSAAIWQPMTVER